MSKEKLDCFQERFRDICSHKVKVPSLTVMRDVAITKSEFEPGERAVTKIQHFQVSGSVNELTTRVSCTLYRGLQGG